MVVAGVGKVAEGIGEVVGAFVGKVVSAFVGASVGVVLTDGLSAVSKVSLSPNVPSSPSKDTKQEAGGSVATDVAYLYV